MFHALTNPKIARITVFILDRKDFRARKLPGTKRGIK